MTVEHALNTYIDQVVGAYRRMLAWIEHSTPGTAPRAWFLVGYGTLLFVVATGVTAAYVANSPAAIVPADLYIEHTTDFRTGGEAAGSLLVISLLALADIVGRFWYEWLLWVPLPVIRWGIYLAPMPLFCVVAEGVLHHTLSLFTDFTGGRVDV